MYMANPVGFHTSLTDEVKAKILSFVESALVISVIAKVSRVPRETLRRWLRKGEEEAKKGEWTIYSQLWVELEEKRGQEIIKITEDVRKRSKNWQATWELLKVLAREDYGVEAEEYKELLAEVKRLSEYVDRLRNNRLQTQGGTINHGREMDSESHSEE